MGCGVNSWGELRCAACITAGRYSKILLKYAIGSVTSDGEIAVQCKCGSLERLTAANQYCDGVRTFRTDVRRLTTQA